MKRDEAAYLLDMLLAAKDALELSPGLTFQQFTENCLHQNAIFKSIEIIGEAPLMLAGKTTKKTPRFHGKILWVLEIVSRMVISR